MSAQTCRIEKHFTFLPQFVHSPFLPLSCTSGNPEEEEKPNFNQSNQACYHQHFHLIGKTTKTAKTAKTGKTTKTGKIVKNNKNRKNRENGKNSKNNKNGKNRKNSKTVPLGQRNVKASICRNVNDNVKESKSG